jgi:hypothetical protein
LIPNERAIFVSDAHHGDGKRFIVHADEKLTSFWNWNSRLSRRGAM